ncbi:hypothetical protein F5Y13DRAFT_99712 [Hypoxylon sp. FL1857]|nr:hypothetical protein F5Y13DRAFT_99712 [Hypoxylon sp. FL1857]
MLIIILTLLCVVVSQSHGLEPVRAEHSSNRFNKRIPSQNGSATAVATLSLDILASSLAVANSETHREPIDTVSNTITSPSTSDVSVIVVPSASSSAPPTDDALLAPLNLGTITTIARPTLVLPTTTPTRVISTIATDPVDSNSSSTSNTDVGASFPTIGSTSTSNATRPWNWNTTSSATSPSSPTVTLPPLTTSTPVSVTATPSECPAKESGPVTVTSYIVIHTSTITWTGDPADYIPPYVPITTPIPCTPKESPTGRFTITFCDGLDGSCSIIRTSTGDLVNPTPAITVTLVTTDKNPAVVFPTETPPDYGGSPGGPNGHESAVSGGAVATPDYGMLTDPVESAKSSPTPAPSNGAGNNGGSNSDNNNGNSGSNNGAAAGPGATPVTVIVLPGQVIVDDHTFIDNPTRPTSTVVVGSETFVIDPSRVVGAGATVSRPPPNAGGVSAPMPMPITTNIGGLGVVYGPSIATIDGTVFTIKPTPTVAVIKGQTVTLGPTGIVFPSQTLHVAAGPGPIQTAVMGGELITVIGPDKVVIEGTTITYGPDSDLSSTFTTVIDGDTILIAPTGIILHGQTLGGVTAAPGSTEYEIAGGATITQMGLTAVEIGGETFHVGLDASTAVTTVIGDHTLTIGPKGVGMETWTLGAPYASTTTLMPGHGGGGNAAMTFPTATGTAHRENGCSASRPHRAFAIGVGCLGTLLFWL